MPIYNYKCPVCEREFTEIQKMSDDPIIVCSDECPGVPEKQISKSSFALKGKGWFKDGYR